jgi:drug/metabolite transporter (DMT)-like permease
MSIGTGIALFVVGAIMAFAFTEQQIGALNVQTLGYILMLAGALTAVLSFALAQRGRRRDTVAVNRDSSGREVTERRTETSGGPSDPVV